MSELFEQSIFVANQFVQNSLLFRQIPIQRAGLYLHLVVIQLISRIAKYLRVIFITGNGALGGAGHARFRIFLQIIVQVGGHLLENFVEVIRNILCPVIFVIFRFVERGV